MNMLNKTIKKLRSRGGFTLSELLVTMVILLISTGVIAQTLSHAFHQYRRQTLVSEAGVLCDTLSLAVQEELSNRPGALTLPFNDDAGAFVDLNRAAYGSLGLTANLEITGDGEPFTVTLTVSAGDGVALAENKFAVYPVLIAGE